MKKLRIYIDTSVIGGCEDEEFSEDSRQLMEEFRLGLKTAVISDLTRREIEGAPEDRAPVVDWNEGGPEPFGFLLRPDE